MTNKIDSNMARFPESKSQPSASTQAQLMNSLTAKVGRVLQALA